ncbi:ABC transporter permease [Oceanobacter mangrovi]|uniref:ABC transporter permease n=1 Tax=Oceanobacter mangrovi TaxID=2862510 RepID=UPI001C8EB043|nr:ABC transporter permease [Oceanobacter mangrovi]
MKRFYQALSASQWLGAIILLLLLLFALLEAALGSADPARQALSQRLLPPSGEYWLGTDQFGRSNLARLAQAVRLSLLLALLSVTTAALFGVVLGVLAGWRGGWIDRLLDMLVTTVLALPGLVLILLFAAIVPGSFVLLYIGIAVTLWVEYFRLVRAITRQRVHSPQLQSSAMLGFGYGYLFRRHIWPYLAGQVLTLMAFGGGASVLAMAATGFVYVGLKPPTAELGLMIVELFPFYAEAPWVLAQPMIALFLLVLGCNLLATRKP